MIFCLYVFFISLVIFLLLIDSKKIHIYIYGGIIAAVFKLALNLIWSHNRAWKYNVVSTSFPASFLFSESFNIIVLGIAFTMGILFLQLLPDNLYLQLFHAIAFAVFYMLLNVIFNESDIMTFIHIKPYASSHPLLFFLSLAWFKTNFLCCNKHLST